MLFKLNAAKNSAHVRVAVFAGPDRDHLALCGTLTFRHPEWDQFRLAMERGDTGLVVDWR